MDFCDAVLDRLADLLSEGLAVRLPFRAQAKRHGFSDLQPISPLAHGGLAVIFRVKSTTAYVEGRSTKK